MQDELLYGRRTVLAPWPATAPQARNAPAFAMYERLAEIAADSGTSE